MINLVLSLLAPLMYLAIAAAMTIGYVLLAFAWMNFKSAIQSIKAGEGFVSAASHVAWSAFFVGLTVAYVWGLQNYRTVYGFVSSLF